MDRNSNLISFNGFWNNFGEKSIKVFYNLLNHKEKVFHFDFYVE